MKTYQVYVINLDKDVERMQFMDTQLTKLGIEYIRLSGVYGREIKNLSDVYDDVLAKKYNGKSMLLNEIGCALSHKKAYDDFLEKTSLNEKLEYALVLEDDVQLPNNFKEIIEQEIEKNNKSQKWEYLLFDYVKPGFTMWTFWIRSLSVAIKQRKQDFLRLMKFLGLLIPKFVVITILSVVEGLRDIYYKKYKKNGGPVKFYRSLYLAGCYALNKVALQKMVGMHKKIVYAADRLPDEARKRGMKFYAYAPLCVEQKREEYGSSIIGLSGQDFKVGKHYSVPENN